MDPTTDRIKQILESFGYSPSLFADEIDVQRSSISHILSGRNKPSLDLIQKILKRFPDLNPGWLLTGIGEMNQLNIFGGGEEQETHATPQMVTKEKLMHAMVSPNKEPREGDSANKQILKEEAQESYHVKPAHNQQTETVMTEELPKPSPAPAAVKEEKPQDAPVPSVVEKPQESKQKSLPDEAMPFLGGPKKIERIVVFYEDKTFAVYNPE